MAIEASNIMMQDASFWEELLTELSETLRKDPNKRDLNRHILAVLGKGYSF